MKKMKFIPLFVVISFFAIFIWSGCDEDDAGSTAADLQIPAITTAFGESLPTGYKTGGTVSTRTTIGLGDAIGSDGKTPFPNTGNVLWLVWDLQYKNGEMSFTSSETDPPCTAEEISNGSCFKIHPSTSNALWTYYKRPKAIDDPTSCQTSSQETSGDGTSLVAKACNFESILYQMSTSVKECYNSAGTTVDLSKLLPWGITKWGIPESIKIQGSYKTENSSNIIWYGINKDITGQSGQYMANLSAAQGNYGARVEIIYLDREKQDFFHFASNNSGDQRGFMAFMGELPTTEGGAGTGSFEAMQVLEYTGTSTEKFTIRMKSNGQYIWLQNWQYVPGESGFNADTPASQNGDLDWCLKIENNMPSSIYVAESECFASFGKADRAAMNDDSNYNLKLEGITLEQYQAVASGTQYTESNYLTTELGVCYP